MTTIIFILIAFYLGGIAHAYFTGLGPDRVQRAKDAILWPRDIVNHFR